MKYKIALVIVALAALLVAAVWPVTVDSITVEDGVVTDLQVTNNDDGTQWRLPAGVTPTLEPVPVAAPWPPPSTENALGTFGIRCEFSHTANDDPIVFPGQPGASHTHEFFGNTGTDAHSTRASLLGGPTSCHIDGATQAYWTPALYDGSGAKVEPSHAMVYYRNHAKAYGSTVAFPDDWEMVFGIGGGASFPRDVQWACDSFSGSQSSQFNPNNGVPDCPSGKKLKLRIDSPNCWDGKETTHLIDSAGLIYRQGTDDPESCPASHPIKVPELSFRVVYGDGDGGAGWHFASNAAMHADFLNAWDSAVLNDLHEQCTAFPRDCGQSGTAGVFPGLP